MMERLGRSTRDAPLRVSSDLLERTIHDLKNPLAVVRATLEWLELELRDRADALDAVHDATTAAERLMAIVDEFGVLAQLEMGAALARDPLDLRSVIESVTDAAGPRLGPRKIFVASDLVGSLPMMGVAPMLARALDALLDVTARGATTGACVEVRARVVPARVERGPEMLEVTVGLRGVDSDATPIPSIDALSSGGIGVYLALRVFEGHGGTVAVVPTATVPRVVVLLPR